MSSPGRKRVVVIEDDPDIRESLGEVLVESGYSVALAANGKEALEQLQLGPPPAAILLDLMMPVMDGWQFRAAQRAALGLRDIPVVVVSADGNLQEKAAAIQATAYLRKPINIVDLLRILEHISRGEPDA
jgi:CheY-like chemotaxis protein